MDQLIKAIAENKELAGLIGTGLAYVASEIIGASKLKSTGLVHLLINIVKGIIEVTTKKEGK